MARSRVRRMILWLGGLSLLPVALIAIFAVNLIWFKPFNIDYFYERVFIREMLDNPELLSSLRIVEPFHIYFHNDELTDISDEHSLVQLARAKGELATLRSYSIDGQSPEQRLSTKVLDWFIDDQVRAEPFLYHSYPVNQMTGVQSDLPNFMATLHMVTNEHEAEDYIARLDKFGWKFDQLLVLLDTRAQKGVIAPKFVIQRMLDQTRGFVASPPEENILYTSFREKLENNLNLTGPTAAPLLDRAKESIRTTVYPSFEKLIAKLETLDGQATEDDGVWKLPNGDAYYAFLLRSHTTTEYTPQEVHDLGLREVERITTEMRAILDAAGREGGTVGEWMTKLANDPQFLYPDSDDGRTACLADYQRIIDEVDPKLDAVFDIRPEDPVKVERVPVFKEATEAGAYYYPPAMDGSRPGIFYANLRDMKEIPKWGMETLVYHEAIPGHHFQLSIQQNLKGVPTFRKLLPFTAYTEGWALYAEYLAREEGYFTGPYDELGQLQSELFRACRLVVDTGIHYKRWTRQQAIDYMIDVTGMPKGDVTAEIERYIVMPGRACAYKVGQLKILELRDKAKAALGAEFTLNGFHDAALKNGSLPLEILEEVVDDYIAAVKAGETEKAAE